MIMTRSRLFFILGGNKTCIFCHNTRSSVCLILRQTVDPFESIGNYLDNWLVDNYADPKKEKKTLTFLRN